MLHELFSEGAFEVQLDSRLTGGHCVHAFVTNLSLQIQERLQLRRDDCGGEDKSTVAFDQTFRDSLGATTNRRQNPWPAFCDIVLGGTACLAIATMPALQDLLQGCLSEDETSIAKQD